MIIEILAEDYWHPKITIKIVIKNILYIVGFLIYFSSCSTIAMDDSLSYMELHDGWIDCGGSSWYQNKTLEQNNNSIFQSGPIENSGVSRICRVVKGPATVSFWWKTNANIELGQLNFLVNGEKTYLCDSKNGKYEFFDLRYEGNYILTWEFIKYRSYPQNYGSGWIGDIKINRESLNKSMVSSDSMTNNTDPYFNLYDISTQIYQLYFPPNNSSHNYLYASNDNKDKIGENLSNSSTFFVKDEDNPNANIYCTIEKALQKARDGDIIMVSSKICEEKIELNKSIKLIGEDRAKSIIKGSPNKNSVIYITANDVIIQNLTIENGKTGLCLKDVCRIELVDNNISNCTKGGVWLIDSNNISIKRNDFNMCGNSSQNQYIRLDNSNYINITENNLNPRSIVTGIYLNNSNYNIILNNTIKDLYNAIALYGNSGGNTLGPNSLLNSEICDIYNDSSLWKPPTCGTNKFFGNWIPC